MSLEWRGDEVKRLIGERIVEAVTEIDGRIEARAKEELYEGHGKRSGNLRRAIQGAVARIEGTKVKGEVAVRGVPYALRIHKLYRYIVIGYEEVAPRALDIISRFVRGRP